MKANKIITAIKAAAIVAAGDILAAERGADAAASAYSSAVSLAIIGLVDAMSISGLPRTEEGVKTAKETIKEAFLAQQEGEDLDMDRILLGDAIALKIVSAKVVDQYRIRAVKLWYYSKDNDEINEAVKKGEVPYTLLAELPTPFARAGGRPAAKKASKVESVSRETLDKAIADAIAAATALGLKGFAASLAELAKASLSK